MKEHSIFLEGQSDIVDDFQDKLMASNAARLGGRSSTVQERSGISNSDRLGRDYEDLTEDQQLKILHQKTSFIKKTQEKANKTLRW